MSALDLSQAAIDYDRIENAIQYLETHFHSQPSLSEIADQIGLSEYHFQRLFSREASRSLCHLRSGYARRIQIQRRGDYHQVRFSSQPVWRMPAGDNRKRYLRILFRQKQRP